MKAKMSMPMEDDATPKPERPSEPTPPELPVVQARADGYAFSCKLKDGTQVRLRGIRPADEAMMVKFHEALSDASVYFRYMGPLKLSQRTEHERLKRICAADREDGVALVAERSDARSEPNEILGVGRLMKCDGASEAEFALVVEDDFQGLGLGRQLLRRLIRIAGEKGWRKVMGHILPDNRPMLHVSEKLGFKRVQVFGSPVVRVELEVLPGEGTGRDTKRVCAACALQRRSAGDGRN